MTKQKGLQQLNAFPSHRGGDTCSSGGYIFEYAPDHPLCNNWGWVAQHRLVAETMTGRSLIRSKDPKIAEVVHHRDGCKTNNRPENLEILTRSAHANHHARERSARWAAKLTVSAVARALEGRTIREAAEVLGTTHMTIRRRFPDLIANRKRRAPANVDDPKWPDLIRPLAADPRCSMRDAVQRLNISAVPIRRICEKHGIVWMQNASRKEGGFGRPKGSKVLDVTDPKWPALVRPLADDPACSMSRAAQLLGVGEAQLRNIRAYFGIAWVFDRSARLAARSRLTATPTASADGDSPTAPARRPRMARKLVS